MEHSKIQQEIDQLWQVHSSFGVDFDSDKAAYSINMPPPNVTGFLHIGHALTYSIQDLFIRFERMQGKEAHLQLGLDHAGIATQRIVELGIHKQQGKTRKDFTRQEFINEIVKWKEKSRLNIISQLKKLGVSCDYSKERFTLDEEASQAVTKTFVELYNNGLIKKDKRLVNWDPSQQTALSDLEIASIESKGKLYSISYRLENPTAEYSSITIATTRPETLLGDTAIAVHPEDIRYQSLIGNRAIVPLLGRHIPIIADEIADPEKGSGAVKITPAHDFNDYEAGIRHNLKFINILKPNAHLKLKDNKAFLEGIENTENFKKLVNELDGLERFLARKKILQKLEEKNHLEGFENIKHAVPFDEKTKSTIIEPYLTKQWYINTKPLAKAAIEAVRNGKVKIFPKHHEKTFFNWMENIEPWCISRQIWWGHQIPAWYDDKGNCVVAENKTSASKIYSEKYGTVAELKQDPDVLDTWYSSSLWPFTTLGWPNVNLASYQKFYPTDVLITGADILFFWVARMIMMGLYFTKQVPFHNVYIHGLVRDENHQKMSKTKGNTVDPRDIIDKYGVDVLRMSLLSIISPGRDLPFSERKIQEIKKFVNKIVNSFNFAEINNALFLTEKKPNKITFAENYWIISKLQKAMSSISDNIQNYQIAAATKDFHNFLWNDLCDWYIEMFKAQNPLKQEKLELPKTKEHIQTMAYVLTNCLKLMQPFLPYLSEYLWQKSRNYKDSDDNIADLLISSSWQNVESTEEPNDTESKEAIITIENVKAIIKGTRSVRKQLQIPMSLLPELEIEVDKLNLQNFEKASVIIKSLTRVSKVYFVSSSSDHEMKKGAQPLLFTIANYNLKLFLPADFSVDFAKLLQILNDEIADCTIELQKSEKRLSNDDFVRNAPEQIIKENKNRIKNFNDKIKNNQLLIIMLEKNSQT